MALPRRHPSRHRHLAPRALPAWPAGGAQTHSLSPQPGSGRTPNRQLRPTDTLDISKADAQQLGLRDGQPVCIRSRYGVTILPVRISDALKAGEVFATFSDPRMQLNAVTSRHRDRFVKTPEYKRTAVAIELVDALARAH